ncbi:PIN-like domain-containing protein [Pseudomonas sp. CNPSo 3701]|uniref:PIN-like domain-containing protein n=1 Tax=Pseudomonas sp. CNPSo 3701 TaxID=3027943 RepID=UPI00236448CE|nr:PIN-like domain-containing protein [Pseudomonas sp. CNPSo 3701]MDD1507299.1 PIN domain-containing protein [Pseudomonas sp. CNPSo 3701]
MKGKFPGHFLNADLNESIWSRCIFVFDTNILLNLYRYSDETRTLFIKTLQNFQDRIWIPHRVAIEYLENRLDVIYEQQEEYEKAISEIKKLKTKLENSRQHPFISNESMTEVSLSLDKACEELETNKGTHSNRINSDDIKTQISEIFDDEKIGEAFSNEELEEILKEGADRYKEKVPPGYSDIKKQGTDESIKARCRPYGDLIIWKAIIKKSIESDLPIIFVTDDGKEDWWHRFKGKTLGPRPELIEEFKEKTQKEFYMYLPERFLSFAAAKIEEQPSKEILDEIRDIRSKESDQASLFDPPKIRFKTSKKSKNYFTNKSISILEKGQLAYNLRTIEREATDIENSIQALVEERNALARYLNDYIDQNYDADNDPYSTEEYLSLQAEHGYTDERIEALDSRLEHIRSIQNKLLHLKNQVDKESIHNNPENN